MSVFLHALILVFQIPRNALNQPSSVVRKTLEPIKLNFVENDQGIESELNRINSELNRFDSIPFTNKNVIKFSFIRFRL